MRLLGWGALAAGVAVAAAEAAAAMAFAAVAAVAEGWAAPIAHLDEMLAGGGVMADVEGGGQSTPSSPCATNRLEQSSQYLLGVINAHAQAEATDRTEGHASDRTSLAICLAPVTASAACVDKE